MRYIQKRDGFGKIFFPLDQIQPFQSWEKFPQKKSTISIFFFVGSKKSSLD